MLIEAALCRALSKSRHMYKLRRVKRVLVKSAEPGCPQPFFSLPVLYNIPPLR